MTDKLIFKISKQVLALVFTLASVAHSGAAFGQPEDSASCPDAPKIHTSVNWDVGEIAASHQMNTTHVAADRPIWHVDPLNITMVAEAAGQRLSFLNGDSFELLGHITLPYGAFSAAAFSPDGRFLFVLSCDGWVQKYDIWSLQPVGQIRAGIAANFLAISVDGLWLAVAGKLPASLVILSTEDMSLTVRHEVVDNGAASRISALHPNPPRESFVLSLQDAPAIWEVFYGPNPPDIGFSHDWRIEGIAVPPAPFPIRKIAMPDIAGSFNFDPSFEYVLASSESDGGGMVADLVIGQNVPAINLPDLPIFGTVFSWQHGNETLLAAIPKQGGPLILVDMKTWNVIGRIQLGGPGQFVGGHEGSPFLWVGVSSGPNTGALHLIDKHTREVIRILHPASGANISNVAFDKDGSHAFVAISEEEGAVIVYDAITGQKITQISMQMPSGSYNIGNLIFAATGIRQ